MPIKKCLSRFLFHSLLMFTVLITSAVAVLGQSNGFSVIDTINVSTGPFGATLAPGAGDVWIANSGTFANNGDTVSMIDTHSLTLDPTTITVQLFPEDIAFGRLGFRAFVTNSTSSSLSVINTITNTVTQNVDLSGVPMDFPFGVAVSLNDQKIFVTTQGDFGKVAVLQNGPTVSVIDSIFIPGFSGRPAVVPFSLKNPSLAGKILISSAVSETGPPVLNVIDPATDSVINSLTLTGNTAFPQATVVTPDGRFAYTTLFDFSGGTGGVWVVDLKALKTVTVINTGDPNVFGAGITHDGRFVFATNFVANQVVAIDTTTNAVVATVAVGRQPNDVAVTLDDKRAFVTNQNSATVSVLSVPD